MKIHLHSLRMPKEVVEFKDKESVYFVYMLQCADNTLYTGSTNDIEKRVDIHNTGKTVAKYTKARRPVKLIYVETLDTKSAALKREWKIKRLSRVEKLALANPRHS